VLLAALLVASCGSDPEKEKIKHLQRGDEYAATKRDEFAAVEYLAAVKLDPKFGEAQWKLAQTYERLGNVRAAAPAYIRAADALPDDRAAQLKATQVLLVAGQYADAKARIGALVAKNPKDVDALMLHATATAALKDPAAAIAEIEEALRIDPQNSEVVAGLGIVHMQSGAAKEAEAAFRRAIDLDPSSVDVKLALANFLVAAGRGPEAEVTLKQALEKEPKHVLANRMLAMIYITTRRADQAEPLLKTIADGTKAPEDLLQLADFYARVGRRKDARDLLTPMSAKATTAASAETRLAALDYADGHIKEAYQRLDYVAERANPNHGPVLVLKARWLLEENKVDEALKQAEAAVAAGPQSASAHFVLATAYNRRGQTAEAIKSYQEVVRLNPRMTAAQAELSRLSLTTGDSAAALRYAEDARRTEPRSISGRVALVRSLVTAGNLARAETEVAELLKGAPDAASVHVANGVLQIAKKNAAGARSSFEKALALAPGFVDALSGLTTLDIQAKMPAKAIARLETEIGKQAASAPLLAMVAQAYEAAGDNAKAEQALRRAVSIDPRFNDAYVTLAQLYIRQGRIDEARAEFEGMGRRDPQAFAARTMAGILFEVQGKREEARKAYEATIGSPEKAPVAANNLAFIYAEQGIKLDLALQLATAAKQQMPDDPSVDDTLGWVYYKKNLPALAVKPLEESIKKRPDSAEVLYHLGLTYAKLDDKTRAREALERALKLDPNVGGGEAKRVLATLSR
jgi:tetratricopeptide (TPR) repeat protein